MKQVVVVVVCALFTTLLLGENRRVLREVFKHADQLEMLHHPDSVEVCILYRGESPTGNDSPQLYTESPYKRLTPGAAALVTWKLTNDANYQWDIRVDCDPERNARVRYKRNGHTLTVDFLFGCGIVVFEYDGAPFSDAVFTPGIDWVFQVVEEAFPEDKVVRVVKKDRERKNAFRLDAEKAKALEAEAKLNPS